MTDPAPSPPPAPPPGASPWQQVRHWFDVAQGWPAAERSAQVQRWLPEGTLRQEVLALLAADAAATAAP
ncbi:hypothetical protein, partial [Ideonella livida]